MATMFLVAFRLCAQTSASGCGILNEYDAAEAPAVPVSSNVYVRARPAPLALPELSSLRVGLGLRDYHAGAWLDGRGGPGWTELMLGARIRWTVDSTFAVGIAPRVRSQWFSGFTSRHTATWDVHAVADFGSLHMGIALRDIPLHTQTSRPFLHTSAMLDIANTRVAFDLGMNASDDLWVGLTAELPVTASMRLTASVRTLPTSMHAALQMPIDTTQSIAVSCRYQQDLGITPELVWIWCFGA